MSRFDEREQEFEARFKHDQELAFKVKVRRDKLLGLWAAGHLGLVGAAADAYAKDIVSGDVGHKGDGDLVARLAQDFAKHAIAIAAPQISDQLQRCAAEAKKQIMKE